MTSKTWFITGCGTGIGRALAEAALGNGDQVTVTDRNFDLISELASQYPATALAIGIDVTKPDQVKAGMAQAMEHFGRLDVLVNNAGYAVQSAVEETDMASVRAMFEVNFFGMLDVVTAALPYLRSQGHGHIINFSSIGGRVSGPLVALYGASKFAVEGMSEGLAHEVASFGIKVTAVEPGAFATEFGASVVVPNNRMEAYAPLRDGMQELLAGLPQGDPADLAAAIVKMVYSPNPPQQFIGGADAYAMVAQSLERQRIEMEEWRALSAQANGAALQSG